MRRLSLVTAVAAVAALSLCTFAHADDSIPTWAAYQGTAVDPSGQPLQGTYDLQFRYLDIQGDRELLLERQSRIPINQGRFQVKLGIGEITPNESYASLEEVFSRHPELLMEVSIDGRVQNPWIKVLPAGHSPATTAALSGPVGVDNDTLHWKGYESRSPITGIQAVVLGPADDNQAGPVPVESDRFTNPMLADMIFLGESIAARDLPTIDSTARPEVEAVEVNRPRHEDLYDRSGRRFGTTTEKVRDPLVGRSLSPGRTPAPMANFEGIGNVNGVLPPDTEGTVGPNHYIQVVNLSFAIYSKADIVNPAGDPTPIVGPVNTNTLWAGFGGACQNDNSGDAIFMYDQPADRYVLTQFAVSSGLAVCFAVSTTPDPTGSYFLYQLNAQRFPDYYKLGVWPDPQNNAYFMSTNSGFQGQYDVYAIDRQNLLAGTTPRVAQFFQNYVNLFMPADVDGPAFPAAADPDGVGRPGLLYTFRDGGEPYFGSPPTDSIDLWEFDVDWNTPANSTFTLIESFIPPELAEFNWSVCGFFVSNCLPQPDTGQGIDSASWWPMQRFVYRNFGTHESLVGVWTVDVNGTPDLAAPRWFELRRTPTAAPEGSGWSIYQQGTYSPDSTHRFMPSIAMDGDGNILMVYSVTSDSIYPSIRYAARAAGDPLGTMQAEQELIAGSGSQLSSSSRWGDYASTEVDPEDDCTFWFTTEYIVTTGNAPWQTRVGTAQVPGCGGLQVTPASQTVCTDVGSVDFDVTLLDQFTGTTNLSVDECPGAALAGAASCNFNPNPVVFPTTMSTFTVGNLGSVPAGDYPMVVTATDAGDPMNTRDTNLLLTLFESPPGSTTLDSPADGATGVDRAPVLTWNAAPGAQTYFVQVARDPGFSDMVVNLAGVTGTSLEVSPALDPLTTYYWRVFADNPCGNGGGQEFSFTTADIPPILLVDDDNNSPDVGVTYIELFDALGYPYDVWDTQNSANEPTADDLAPYATVIWFSGGVFSNDAGNPLAGPNDASEVALGQWLDGSMRGGALWDRCFALSSQDYGWDQGGQGADNLTTFMQTYLRVASYTSDVTQGTATGAGSIFGGLGPYSLSYPFTNFSDRISPAADGELAFAGSAGDAAVNSVAGPASYQTAWLGFPLEAVATLGERLEVMNAFLASCQVEQSTEIFSDGFESGDTSAWTTSVP